MISQDLLQKFLENLAASKKLHDELLRYGVVTETFAEHLTRLILKERDD